MPRRLGKAKRLARASDVGGLIDLLAHGTRHERRGAAQRLGELGDPQALEPLATALLSTHGEDEDLAPIIVSAIARFPDPRASKALIALLAERKDDAFYFFAHRDALLALAERGVLAPLHDISTDQTRPEDLRGEAKELLRKLQ
jgi:HEAT repeat protein